MDDWLGLSTSTLSASSQPELVQVQRRLLLGLTILLFYLLNKSQFVKQARGDKETRTTCGKNIDTSGK